MVWLREIRSRMEWARPTSGKFMTDKVIRHDRSA